MKKIILALSLMAFPSYAQSINVGAGVVMSKGLGFDKYYSAGVVEVSGTTDSIVYRVGVEILDAEKANQDGWGGRFDVTVTKKMGEHWGLLAFYRPSWIEQTDYSKMAHQFGAGVAFTTKKNGRWDLYFGAANDDYKQKILGFEMRIGSGHWFRVKGEHVMLTHPLLHDKLAGSRISVMLAPRIKW